MRVTIDQVECLNSGQCAYLQPQVFGLDDDGVPSVLVSDVEGELADAARDAAAMCPSGAIRLTEAELPAS